jgi:hypothetical protein
VFKKNNVDLTQCNMPSNVSTSFDSWKIKITKVFMWFQCESRDFFPCIKSFPIQLMHNLTSIRQTFISTAPQVCWLEKKSLCKTSKSFYHSKRDEIIFFLLCFPHQRASTLAGKMTDYLLTLYKSQKTQGEKKTSGRIWRFFSH